MRAQLPEPYFGVKGLEMASSVCARGDQLSQYFEPGRSDGFNITDEGRGKPGWVSKVNNSVIEFNLTFGKHPSMTFTYLRSYEGVGPAELTLNGISAQLDPIWEKRASMSRAGG